MLSSMLGVFKLSNSLALSLLRTEKCINLVSVLACGSVVKGRLSVQFARKKIGFQKDSTLSAAVGSHRTLRQIKIVNRGFH